MRQSKNNQKGATMTEMLGVLTIIILMSASALSLIGNIWGMFKQNMVVNEIRDLQQSLSKAYRAEGNYNKLFEGWSASNDKVAEGRVCNEKIAPFQMCANGELHHRQGGRVWLYPILRVIGADGNVTYESRIDGTVDRYKLTVKQLPKKTCAAIATVNWFLNKKPDIFQMTIIGNGKTITLDLPQNTAADVTKTLYNFSTTDAMEYCNKSDGNEIQLTFF